MASNRKIKIARVQDLKDRKSIVARGPDGLEIVLFRGEDNKIYALENSCPHMGGPLGEGEVNGCVVTCPWHGWEFDIRNGSCLNMPGDDAVPVEIIVENDEIYIRH